MGLSSLPGEWRASATRWSAMRCPSSREGLRVGAPVARPGKVVCIGLNYRDHAAETGAAIPPSRWCS